MRHDVPVSRGASLVALVSLALPVIAGAQSSGIGSAWDGSSGPSIRLPTGQRITPTATPGSTFAPLNPGIAALPSYTAGQAVSTAVSPDGRTLLVLTSGYNQILDSSGVVNPALSNE
jgi:hypothetical protein